jgi:hypothetical protein
MKIIAFTIADQNNQVHADKLEKSFHHFHPDIELKVYSEKDIGNKINYYRSTPMFAKDLIDEYDLVLKLDSDQLVVGNLDFIFDKGYDVGTVLNFNRVDPPKYGNVAVFDIAPTEYMNCGLVAMRSKRFIDHWWDLCNSNHFNNLKYKEQDLLNVLVHYGDYDITCFDFPDQAYKYSAWHGLISKGEYLKMEMRNGKLILPKAKDNYPEQDKEIKVLHSAGGGFEKRIGDSYRRLFNEEVIKYIDSLIK